LKGEDGYVEIKLPLKPKGMFRRIWYFAVLPFKMIFKIFWAIVRGLFSAIITVAEPLLRPVFLKVNHYFDLLGEQYDRLLIVALNNRKKTLLLTLVLLGITIAVGAFMRKELFPPVDEGQFTVEVRMPRGTTLEGTSELVSTIESLLMNEPSIDQVLANIGMIEELSFLSEAQSSIDKASILVRVREGAKTQAVMDKMRTLLSNSPAANVDIELKHNETTFAQILNLTENDVQIKITGEDLEISAQIAERFLPILQTIDGLVDVRTAFEKGNPEYRIAINREKAGQYGLSVSTVAALVSNLVKGREATYLSDFDRKVTILVRPTLRDRDDLDDVLSSEVRLPIPQAERANSYLTIPLRELITYTRTVGYSEIWRENQTRQITIAANLSHRDIESVVHDVKQAAQQLHLPRGYAIDVGGTNDEMRDSFRGLILSLILSALLMYMILAAEYEGLVFPFIIMFSVPLALIGAILLLFVTGQSLSVISLVGMVVLIGIADNDAVVKVDFIIRKRKEGLPLREAIIEAGKQRFRPIVMNTITVVFGLLPLMLSTGRGAELRNSLSFAIVGGLISATFLTLVVIPVIYTYFDKFIIRNSKT
jgi:HAE1 family hydrophobic/amphiphilic exporter-1